jgi:hypothetical protein
MKSLTPQQIVALGPCRGYDLEQIIELFDNKESVTYLEILDTDKIPLADIVWVFCQPDVLSIDIRNQWLEIIATRAVTNYALHCGVDDVEKWAENWLSGKDKTFNAARNAVHAAASAGYNATAYTAYNAAYAAYNAGYDACVATSDAARAATSDAARAATSDAARAAVNATDYAARKTERKQQIQDLKDILQGEK